MPLASEIWTRMGNRLELAAKVRYSGSPIAGGAMPVPEGCSGFHTGFPDLNGLESCCPRRNSARASIPGSCMAS